MDDTTNNFPGEDYIVAVLQLLDNLLADYSQNGSVRLEQNTIHTQCFM